MTTTATMTIGDLARRTGVAVKVLRRQQDMGLIYTRGRSPAGYRLFDEDALCCVEIVRTLRGLGLTEAEIVDLARSHDNDECAGLVGPRLGELLRRSRCRVADRTRELDQLRGRIDEFEERHRAALTGPTAPAEPDEQHPIS
jgi:DNA-binding transcriptional MerR regulator